MSEEFRLERKPDVPVLRITVKGVIAAVIVKHYDVDIDGKLSACVSEIMQSLELKNE